MNKVGYAGYSLGNAFKAKFGLGAAKTTATIIGKGVAVGTAGSLAIQTAADNIFLNNVAKEVESKMFADGFNTPGGEITSGHGAYTKMDLSRPLYYSRSPRKALEYSYRNGTDKNPPALFVFKTDEMPGHNDHCPELVSDESSFLPISPTGAKRTNLQVAKVYNLPPKPKLDTFQALKVVCTGKSS